MDDDLGRVTLLYKLDQYLNKLLSCEQEKEIQYIERINDLLLTNENFRITFVDKIIYKAENTKGFPQRIRLLCLIDSISRHRQQYKLIFESKLEEIFIDIYSDYYHSDDSDKRQRLKILRKSWVTIFPDILLNKIRLKIQNSLSEDIDAGFSDDEIEKLKEYYINKGIVDYQKYLPKKQYKITAQKKNQLQTPPEKNNNDKIKKRKPIDSNMHEENYQIQNLETITKQKKIISSASSNGELEKILKISDQKQLKDNQIQKIQQKQEQLLKLQNDQFSPQSNIKIKKQQKQNQQIQQQINSNLNTRPIQKLQPQFDVHVNLFNEKIDDSTINKVLIQPQVAPNPPLKTSTFLQPPSLSSSKQLDQILQRQPPQQMKINPNLEQNFINPPLTTTTPQQTPDFQQPQAKVKFPLNMIGNPVPLPQQKPIIQQSQQPILQQPIKSEGIFEALYKDLNYQCSSCGLRFEDNETLKIHMKFHFEQNKLAYKQKIEQTRVPRSEFYNVDDWVQSSQQGAKIDYQQEDNFLHIVDSQLISNNNCFLCNEQLQLNWNSDVEKWIYEDAILAELEETEINKKSYPLLHYNCYKILLGQQDQEIKEQQQQHLEKFLTLDDVQIKSYLY